MAYASDVISSGDGGATFQIQHNGSADRFGIEPVLAYQLSSSGTTLVRKSGVVTVSSGTPGPDASYEDVLPSDIASGELELPAGFFAPDGQHGWLAGFDHAARRALLLATTDGGATWAKVSGIGDAIDAAGGDKLYSGFALDAAHVWIGGSHGVVMHN